MGPGSRGFWRMISVCWVLGGFDVFVFAEKDRVWFGA